MLKKLFNASARWRCRRARKRCTASSTAPPRLLAKTSDMHAARKAVFSWQASAASAHARRIKAASDPVPAPSPCRVSRPNSRLGAQRRALPTEPPHRLMSPGLARPSMKPATSATDDEDDLPPPMATTLRRFFERPDQVQPQRLERSQARRPMSAYVSSL